MSHDSDNLEDSQRQSLAKMVARAMKAEPCQAQAADPAAADEARKFIQERLKGCTAEAGEWLRASSESSERNLGEMSPGLSIEFVNHLYTLGAAAVLAVEIEVGLGDEHQTSNYVVVRLPEDCHARARLFAFNAAMAEDQGLDGDLDGGQDSFFLTLC
ncbi:hypothetical protein PHYC_02533 [Phycisphaerales bacterium]|nr:hypothetical protein PHYC_02533 [Phycisphaerales bacterium]